MGYMPPGQRAGRLRPGVAMSAADILKEKGIQPSHQRIRIWESLAATTAHPSADSIYRQLAREMPTLSRTTVYSTLDLLVKSGLAQRLALSGNELRFDANTSPHAHFHCRLCGEVSDLPGPVCPSLPEAPKGFIVESSQLYAEGLCPRCAAASGFL
jgi:Fur family transcriptional regulator, peroxide stress response regulator